MTGTRLTLHIGTHKTGTTSIQSWCARHAQRLLKVGVCYPELYASKHNTGQHFVAQITSGERAPANPLNNPRISKLLHILDETKAGRILLSSELLSVIPPDRVLPLFSNFDTEVFCILRRQDDYVESMFRELKKSSFFLGTANDFLNAVLSHERLTIFTTNRDVTLKGILPIDYYGMLRQWAAYLGTHKVHAVAYDDPDSGQDALAKLQRFLGIEEEPDDHLSLNMSMSTKIIQARSLLDTHLDWESRMAIRPAIWKANAQLGYKNDQVFFGLDDRHRIFDNLRESNQLLKRYYLKECSVPWLSDDPGISSQKVAEELSTSDFAKIAAFVINECTHKMNRPSSEGTDSSTVSARR